MWSRPGDGGGYTPPGMELTPVMRQYRELKARHPDAVLLFQLGDFYEAFFEDAETVARDLEIILTSREGVPMAGVPVRKADLYVQRLLRKGHKVALASQLERPGQGKKLLKRGVVRVLTPGTVIEEGALDSGLDVLLAARGDGHREPRPLEVAPHELSHPRVVVHHQNPLHPRSRV